MKKKVERYTLIVGNKSIGYLCFIFLLQCRFSDDFLIQATDNNLLKAEELLKLFGYLGIEEDSRKRVMKEIKGKDNKMHKLQINEIKCRKVGAIRK